MFVKRRGNARVLSAICGRSAYHANVHLARPERPEFSTASYRGSWPLLPVLTTSIS
ncbi:hypothetical protein Mapa_017032 [Marchantia paleacea]|nr:hypothetical protein Mapa_017032 [Marchantia paleacea]